MAGLSRRNIIGILKFAEALTAERWAKASSSVLHRVKRFGKRFRVEAQKFVHCHSLRVWESRLKWRQSNLSSSSGGEVGNNEKIGHVRIFLVYRELSDAADGCLFSDVISCPNHILRRLFPDTRHSDYNFRPCANEFKPPHRPKESGDQNFIPQLLF